MFTVKRSYLGETLPVVYLYLDSLNTDYAFESLIIQATESTDILDMPDDITATVTVGSTVYPFPLSGSDFLTAQTGTVTMQCTAAGLEQGAHLYQLECVRPGDGRCGSGIFGMGRYGDAMMLRVSVLPYLQVQVLPVVAQTILAQTMRPATKVTPG